MECLKYRRPPPYQPPPLPPLPTIQRFDRIALLKAVSFNTSCHCMPPRRNILNPPSLPHHSSQPRPFQRRLTHTWQLPPPYIADCPTPYAVAHTKQQPLTNFLICTQQHNLLTNAPVAAPCITTALRTPNLRVVRTPLHSRHHHQLLPKSCVHTACPANYTPDHDKSSRLWTSCVLLCGSV